MYLVSASNESGLILGVADASSSHKVEQEK